MNNHNLFLKISNVSKTFSGVKALNNVQLEVKKGEVHALVGENGAGKSTLIKVLTGVHQPDEGATIFIEGEKFDKIDPLTSVRKGIAVIYQDFSLFPNLTVAENIAISLQIESGKKCISWAEMNKIAETAIKKIGIEIDIHEVVGKLSVAKQQLVAIARALVYDAKMIIMDEPTSALSKNEVRALFNIINKLKEENISVLFIGHKLDELYEISNRFTVFRDGTYIGTYEKDELPEEKLVSLMVGRKVEIKRYDKNKKGEVSLEVKNLSKRGNFKNISFQLKAGEVLGITGLVGSGRSELAQAIFGVTTPDEGEIFINNKKVHIKSTEIAVKNGIAYVPESRQTEGLIMQKSVVSNITVTVLSNLVKKFNIVDFKKKSELADKWISKLNVKPNIPDIEAKKLSGGNQQKLVIAKWLAKNSNIIIVDEPTNGIDIGAKVDIHELLRELAAEGKAVIVISSELPEVMSVSDRILVMKRGRIVAEFDGEKVTQEDIMNKAI